MPRELAEEIAPELDAGRPWSAVVLREQRASPRDPRTGLTMLLAADGEIELRERQSRRWTRSLTASIWRWPYEPS